MNMNAATRPAKPKKSRFAHKWPPRMIGVGRNCMKSPSIEPERNHCNHIINYCLASVKRGLARPHRRRVCPNFRGYVTALFPSPSGRLWVATGASPWTSGGWGWRAPSGTIDGSVNSVAPVGLDPRPRLLPRAGARGYHQTPKRAKNRASPGKLGTPRTAAASQRNPKVRAPMPRAGFAASAVGVPWENASIGPGPF